MFRKFWKTPQPVKEPLLQEATQKEAEELVEDLQRVWGDYLAVGSVMVKGVAIMRPRARAAGFDMKVFRYDPADHPDLPQDLKDWLSCVKNALALKTQLNILLIHREDMKKRLARLGNVKMTGNLQPQSTEFETYAHRQLQRLKDRGVEGIC